MVGLHVVCLVLRLRVSRVKSRQSSHAQQKYAMLKKKFDFWNFLYTCKLSLFRPIFEYYKNYYGYAHASGYVDTPNIVYKSLEVRYIVFSYNYKFRERADVGACCNVALGACCNML